MIRYPHLPEQIFQKLDNESLFKCREVERSWQNIIDGRNYPWLRIANIPTKRRIRNTYLHLAAETGQIEAFKTAFNEEEDKNVKNSAGETPFHLACKNGRLEIVQLLLKNTDLKININAKDNHVIDFNAKTNHGITAFYYACWLGHLDVVKILMENAVAFSIDISTKDNDGYTAFVAACSRGQSDVVKIFIDYASILSIDLNTKAKNGHTAFHFAYVKGHDNVVKLLMKNAGTFYRFTN
jgi:ankyrin repeat protein